MTVHIVTDALRMSKNREPSCVARVFLKVLQVRDFNVVKEYVDDITRTKSIDAVDFKVGTGKRPGNSVIKWSEHSTLYHCGPPATFIGVAALRIRSRAPAH